MTVLFTSGRPLEDADNIKAVYDAYDGPKRFERLGWNPGNAAARLVDLVKSLL